MNHPDLLTDLAETVGDAISLDELLHPRIQLEYLHSVFMLAIITGFPAQQRDGTDISVNGIE